MFSLVHGILFHRLPFAEPDRLLALTSFSAEQGPSGLGNPEVPPHDFADWREQLTSFGGVAAMSGGTVNLSDEASYPERYDVGFVSWNLPAVLGVPPALGRSFNAEDDLPGAPLVVLVGHDVWRNRFERDPDVIDATVLIDGEVATIVGVMPPGFTPPVRESLWLPLRLDLSELERGDGRRLQVVDFMGQSSYALEGGSYKNQSDYPSSPRGVVSPEFFATFGIELVDGRLFDRHDTMGSPRVVVVNESFAAQTWPKENAIGQRLRLGRGDEEEPWRSVVGVVPDAGVSFVNPSFVGTTEAGFYVPQAQMGFRRMSVGVKTQGNPAAFATTLRERLRHLDPRSPSPGPRPWNGCCGRTLLVPRSSPSASASSAWWPWSWRRWVSSA